MRAAVLCLLLVSCTPSVEKMERHDSSMTDSALSVLSSIGSDTVTIERVKTIEKIKTVSKEIVKYVEVESSPVFNAMVSPSYSIGERGCDTVWIRDTVWISR